MLSATKMQRAEKSVLDQQSLRVYCIVQFIDEIQKMPVLCLDVRCEPRNRL